MVSHPSHGFAGFLCERNCRVSPQCQILKNGSETQPSRPAARRRSYSSIPRFSFRRASFPILPTDA